MAKSAMTGVLSLLLVGGLACSGAPGAGLVGSGGSAKAQSVCDHVSKEFDCPCTTVGVGGTATLRGIEYRVAQTVEWVGLDKLPEIQTMDERKSMTAVGNHTIVVELEITNPTPVKADLDVAIYIIDGSGVQNGSLPYNNKVYAKDKGGWLDLWDDDDVNAGQTRTTGLVFAMPPEAMKGSKIVLRSINKRPDPKDPRGRIKSFTDELWVMDLGGPT